MIDPLLLAPIVYRFHNPPLVVLTPDNWRAYRAEGHVPDNVDSRESCEEWLKNLIKSNVNN